MTALFIAALELLIVAAVVVMIGFVAFVLVGLTVDFMRVVR